MTLESIGIIIELKPFGERDLLGRVFTREHGILCGIFKAGQIAKSKPLVGQFGIVSWNARLDSQLGSLHFENEKNLILHFFNDSAKLKFANSCFALLSVLLPEREAYGRLFVETLNMLSSPSEKYLAWEQLLLAELGYSLSLNNCGNCGRSDNLKYISPKTGQAICEDCGKDYKDRLFQLPISLDTTKYFLSGITDLPLARQML